MKGGKTPLGYTIIEVMIVLAVSSVMFLIAANFINGKQERTSFTEGTNEMASRIQDVIEQVTDGQYSDVLQQCSFSGSITTVVPAGGTNAQGTNPTCVFLGKLISFTYPNTHEYQTISLAGGRVDAPADGSAVSLSSVDPAVIPNLTTTEDTQQELDVTGISVTDTADIGGAVHTSTVTPPTTPTSGFFNIGFVQGLGTGDGVGNFQSGAQTISMVYSTLSPTALSNATNSVSLQTAQAVSICLSDGTQQAKLVIGQNSNGTDTNQLSVDVERINPGAPCP